MSKDEEKQPLIPEGLGAVSSLTTEQVRDNAQATRPKPPNRWLFPLAWTLAGALLGILLIGGISAFQYFHSSTSSGNGSSKMSSKSSPYGDVPVYQSLHDTSEILYRPYCEYFEDTYGPEIVQTSMGEPSKHWSPQLCVLKVPGNFGYKLFNYKASVRINAYKAPDAILKVDFTKLAFPKRQDMPILGFGGAFTEAAALNYQTLSEQGKQAVMDLLFGPRGLGYTMGRIPINSCDFSPESYNFDDVDGDFNLTQFDTTLEHDVKAGMVDMALRATSVLRHAWGNDGDGTLKLFVSPWSPPAWMKAPTPSDSSNATHAELMTGSAQPTCLRDGTGPESVYASAWALYMSKYISSYTNLGLPIWGMTVQNEPEFPAPWEACAYTKEEEGKFLVNHLGPQLRKDHPDLKILAFDHNKDHINQWSRYLLDPNRDIAQYVDGIAYHWYASGMDRLLDGAIGQANLHRLQDDFAAMAIKKDRIVLGTESCHCPSTGYTGGDKEIYWSRAERYVHTILADLAAGSNGWLEWNLILDSIGGPNHLGNLCESTLLAVPYRARGADQNTSVLPDFEAHTAVGGENIGDLRTREELNAYGFPASYLDVGVVVQPIYYYMGHISRFVRPGSYAVMGIVESASGGGQTFRPRNTAVLGGGVNDLARVGIELTVWPCEGSTRQKLYWNFRENQPIEVKGHDWLGNPTTSCLSRKVDPELQGLRFVSCEEDEDGKSDVGIYNIIPLVDYDRGWYNIYLTNPKDRKQGTCLTIHDLHNSGGAYGPRGGAQVTLGPCTDASARWKIDQDTGEAISRHYKDSNGKNEVCMTTGWPFLQVGAFLTPQGKAPKTVVILNEANDGANYVLDDENGSVLSGHIPPRSVQTVTLQ